MLKYLSIKNYALIEDIEIDLDSGLSIITGETGAGKSIILGAISLLAGNRADRTMLKNTDKKCIIEASFGLNHLNLQELFDEFDLEYNDETIIRREFNKDGKSRVFINDSPAALLHLKEVMNKMLDVHSQHENLDLNKRQYQLNSIDLMAGNQQLLEKYNKTFKEMAEAEKAFEELKTATLKLRENTEFLSFQLNELSDASLNEHEQEELEEELNTLNHSEEIKTTFHEIENVLEDNEASPLAALSNVNLLIGKIKEHVKGLDEISQRMDNVLIEADDIRRELERYAERSHYDPERLQIVQDRLSLIYQLQQKYRVNTIQDLIAKSEELRQELEDIESIDDRLGDAEKKFNDLKDKADYLAGELSQKRREVLSEMEHKVVESLKLLGMTNCQFEIDLRDLPNLNHDGKNQAEFLFSANKGIEVKPLGKVASGGEISRLMLSIKAMLTSKSELPTIIFDEIDTGISGLIANKMGKIIRAMSESTQVIAITHLPQIAAMGHKHFVVYKDEEGKVSRTNIKEINGEDRAVEVARLLSGEEVSKEALDNAKVLLSATQ